jgi:hypothetical protein
MCPRRQNTAGGGGALSAITLREDATRRADYLLILE